MVTDPQTNTQTDRVDYNTLCRRLARSVKKEKQMNIATKKEAHKQTYMDYVSDAKV